MEFLGLCVDILISPKRGLRKLMKSEGRRKYAALSFLLAGILSAVWSTLTVGNGFGDLVSTLLLLVPVAIGVVVGTGILALLVFVVLKLIRSNVTIKGVERAITAFVGLSLPLFLLQLPFDLGHYLFADTPAGTYVYVVQFPAYLYAVYMMAQAIAVAFRISIWRALVAGFMTSVLPVIAVVVIVGTPFKSVVNEAMITVEAQNIETLSTALMFYGAIYGSYPSESEMQLRGPNNLLTQARILVDYPQADSWGNAYRYCLLPDGRGMIWSLGPDGKNDSSCWDGPGGDEAEYGLYAILPAR